MESLATETDRIIADIEANAPMPIEKIIMMEIQEWEKSDERNWMIQGQRYYRGKNDILDRKRLVIGPDGKKVEAENLSNNKLVHLFLRKLTDQKVGYLLAKPISIQTKKGEYEKELSNVFDKAFARLLKNIGKEAINKGKSWLHVYYDEAGKFSVKVLPSEEIIPIWKDAAHTILDGLIRPYCVETFEGTDKKIVKKVEYWDKSGVRRYINNSGTLIPDDESPEPLPHFKMVSGNSEKAFNWKRVPFICFKYNDEEQPLIELIKTLIDEYDKKKSDNSNNLEDMPESIIVLKNFDGTDLGEFRRNMSQFRAVKVRTDGSGGGGVDSLDIKIDVEAFKTHMEMTRKDIYEFGRGVDTQSQDFGNSPSGIALKFLYADLDMDANDIETEFQASLEQLLWFVDQHLQLSGKGDFFNEPVEFIFNRDIVINESDTITNAKNSVGIISDETIRANHPWVTDAAEETKRIEQEHKQDEDTYPGLDQNKGKLDEQKRAGADGG